MSIVFANPWQHLSDRRSPARLELRGELNPYRGPHIAEWPPNCHNVIINGRLACQRAGLNGAKQVIDGWVEGTLSEWDFEMMSKAMQIGVRINGNKP